MTEAELGYAAGVFDGEGTVTIRNTANRGGYYALAVLVSSTDKPLLDWLLARWGGSLYGRKVRNPRHKPIWQWQLQQNDAKKFLSDVYPYLIIKKERARLARVFGALAPGDALKRSWDSTKKAPQGWRDAQLKLKNKLTQLNKRGVDLNGPPVRSTLGDCTQLQEE